MTTRDQAIIDSDPTFDTGNHYEAIKKNLQKPKTLDNLKEKILNIIKPLGFTDFLFYRLNRCWNSVHKPGLLHSLPSEMLQYYHDHALAKDDIVIEYGQLNNQPAFSSDLYGCADEVPFVSELTEKNRKLRGYYKLHHFYELFVTPQYAGNGSGRVQLVLAAKGKTSKDIQSTAQKHISMCQSLCKAIDWVSTTYLKSTFLSESDLPGVITPKQLKVLTALATQDKATPELAKDLCMSQITAHQHISSARKALGVETNIAAILKAIKIGLIRV